MGGSPERGTFTAGDRVRPERKALAFYTAKHGQGDALGGDFAEADERGLRSATGRAIWRAGLVIVFGFLSLLVATRNSPHTTMGMLAVSPGYCGLRQ